MAKKRITQQQLKLLRRALREKLGIKSGLAGKKAEPKEELTDPDEALASAGKVKRKGYAEAVSRRA